MAAIWLSIELEEVPYQNPASDGKLVAPEKEPDRVTSVELVIIGLPLLTEAFGSLLSVGSSPPALPPDWSHSKLITIESIYPAPVPLVITKYFEEPSHV